MLTVYRVCHRTRIHPVSGTFEGPYMGDYARDHGCYPTVTGGWQTPLPEFDEGLIAQQYVIRPEHVFGCTPEQWVCFDTELLQWLTTHGYIKRTYLVPPSAYVLGATQVAFEPLRSELLSEEELYVCA